MLMSFVWQSDQQNQSQCSSRDNTVLKGYDGFQKVVREFAGILK